MESDEIRLDRKIIGTRIDSLLAVSGNGEDDPTQVDWQAVVEALKAGEWPDLSMRLESPASRP